jgi:hypothetical protein
MNALKSFTFPAVQQSEAEAQVTAMRRLLNGAQGRRPQLLLLWFGEGTMAHEVPFHRSMRVPSAEGINKSPVL